MSRLWSISQVAFLLASVLMAALALAQDALRPTVTHNVTFPGMAMPGEFAVHQQLLELAPGAASPFHMHGGPELILALSGELTFVLEETGEEVTVKTGETYVIPAETYLQVRNDGESDASFVVTFLLTAGATLTTPR